MQRSVFFAGLLLWSVSSVSAWTDEPRQRDKKHADQPKSSLDVAFERLKTLAGDWELVKPPDEASRGNTALSYRLTAGGSAVAETIFPGKEMEMLSVYHRDGDQLLLTHYCCAGNQPRMRARIGKSKDEVVFEFAGGSNMNPAKDMHIHCGLIRFVNEHHLHSEWEYYVDGKSAGKHTFDLVRKN